MGSTILVVDDDAHVRKALARCLRSFLTERKLEIREARDGREALELLKEFTPVLIICDLDMPPGMNGEAFLQAREGAQLDIPVVLNSGNRDLPEIAKRFGVEYAVKGYSFEGIVEIAKRLVP